MITAAAPHAAQGDDLVYVYGVVGGEALDMEQVPPLQGIVPDVPVELVPAGNFAVVVSRVAREIFAVPEAAADAGRDGATDRALAHHRVLSGLAALCTVAPVKYGALCRGMDDILALFERHGGAFEHLLARVAGAQEWGVKLFADREASRAAAEAAPAVAALKAELDAASPGKAFFVRKKLQAVIDGEMQVMLARWADHMHEQIAAHARESAPNPVHRLLTTGTPGHAPILVLDAAYLVDRVRETDFHQCLAKLADSVAAQGCALKLTGPWPPYSFASLDTTEPDDG